MVLGERIAREYALTLAVPTRENSGQQDGVHGENRVDFEQNAFGSREGRADIVSADNSINENLRAGPPQVLLQNEKPGATTIPSWNYRLTYDALNQDARRFL